MAEIQVNYDDSARSIIIPRVSQPLDIYLPTCHVSGGERVDLDSLGISKDHGTVLGNIGTDVSNY